MARAIERHAALLIISLIVALALFPMGARGGSSGTLSSPHYDVGVDLNSDRLYNYLRIDVSVEVSSPGKFTIRVGLNESLDVGEITWHQVSVVLSEGKHLVGVLLDGPEIYNTLLDGPYYAHITLLSDYNQLLAEATHQTAAYSYKNFQAYHARIVPPTSEKALDNDSDKLINWLVFSYTIEVTTPMVYTLDSLLVDKNYTIGLTAFQTPKLDPGKVSLQQFFIGYPLRLAAVDGPYIVTTTLYDSRSAFVDFLYLESAAYSHKQFEDPPALFNPPHADRGEDPDSDGLYNSLAVDVRLSVEVSDTYILKARLSTEGGTGIQNVEVRSVLPQGSATVTLRFSGSGIHATGVDGPYKVELDIYDVAIRKLDSNVHWTASYKYTDFEVKILTLNPPHIDLAVDYEGNGKMNALRVLVSMDVVVAGYVTVEGTLYDPSTGFNLSVVSRPSFVPTGLQVVTLDFPGGDLLEAGLDGPYRVSITVREPSGNIIDQGGHRTKDYLLADFEDGPRARILWLAADKAEDVDGNGYYNRLRVEVSVNVSHAGRYSLEGHLSHSAGVVSSSSTTSVLPAGTSSMTIRFSGPDIRSKGVDGPFIIDLRVRLPGGKDHMDAGMLQTSAFAASSFEYRSEVQVLGRVVSEFQGTPLDGATVWALDYDNHVSRTAPTDGGGNYSLKVYAGSYWVMVDHPNAQARALRHEVQGDSTLDVSLPLPRRVTSEGLLIWTGWDSLTVKVRHVYSADAAALRFHLDWTEGDRDGFVQPEESLLLASPPSTLKEVIDSRSSVGTLTVNGVGYSSGTSPIRMDYVSGPVGYEGLPTIEIIQSFRSESKIDAPTSVEISLETYHDSLVVDQRTKLLIPGGYQYHNWSELQGIKVAGRIIPIVVEPYLTGEAADLTATVAIRLSRRASYETPIPSPPGSVEASVSGGEAHLKWAPTLTNLDGSRQIVVAGYNLYRSSSPGVWTRVNGHLITGEEAWDTPGVGNFDYAISTVNTDGVEGPMSTPLTVMVNSETSTAEGGSETSALLQRQLPLWPLALGGTEATKPLLAVALSLALASLAFPFVRGRRKGPH